MTNTFFQKSQAYESLMTSIIFKNKNLTVVLCFDRSNNYKILSIKKSQWLKVLLGGNLCLFFDKLRFIMRVKTKGF